MSEKVYAVVAGIIQFDPRIRDAGGKQVTDVTVKAVGSQSLVSITIWPEFQLAVPVKKGDWIAADGEFQQRTYQDSTGATREGLQVSAGSLVHVPCVPKVQTQVVQAAPVQVVQVDAAGQPVVVQAPAAAAPVAAAPANGIPF